MADMSVWYPIIFLSVVSAFAAEPIRLVNAEGKDAKPMDLALDASWIGLAIWNENRQEIPCTVIHANPETATLHSECVPKEGKMGTFSLYFWNKEGRQTRATLSRDAVVHTQDPLIHLLKIPKEIGSQWNTAGDVPRKDENWFGGFHPEWELVRIYSLEGDTKNRTFRFQVNTCKASTNSPLLRKVKPATGDDEEELLSESRIIKKDSPLASFPVIEKCIKPLSKSSRGALVTLAKDFSKKIGFLMHSTFDGIPNRDIAQDGSLLRYIGADGLEAAVPVNPSAIELPMALAFEKIFPRKSELGL